MSWSDPCSNCGEHRADCSCGNWGGYKTKIKTPSMKPFDIQKALNGADVITRNGFEVKIGAYNSDATVCIVGWFKNNNNIWNSHAWKNGGLQPGSVGGSESQYDLFMAPVKKKGWVNIYFNTAGKPFTDHTIYDNNEAAYAERNIHYNYLCTTEIEWEE